MSQPASKESLQALHALVANHLAAKITSGEATAADVSNALRMLKDNNITALLVPGSPLKGLLDSLPFRQGADPLDGVSEH